MPSHYPSFDEHSSFLSKHYNLQKQSILTYLISSSPSEVRHNQNIVYCLKFGIWQEIWNTFRRLTDTHSLTESIKICRFQTFRDVLHKEYTTPFLFTIFLLRSVFCACRI